MTSFAAKYISNTCKIMTSVIIGKASNALIAFPAEK